MQTANFIRTMLHVLASPLIWAGHFMVIYVLTALACAGRIPQGFWLQAGMLRVILMAATLAAIGIIMLACMRHASGVSQSRFLQWTTMMLGWLSIYAIILESIPVLMVPPCA